MGRVVRAIIGIGAAIIGAVTGNFALVFAGVSMLGGALLEQRPSRRRDAQAATLQTGEVPRQAIFGRAAEAGSLVDAFNYGGQYGTDWEVLVIALADHRCDALEGFFVNDQYVAFGGDGPVPGYNGQLEVYFRDGRWDQEVPSILTSHGPGWTANDRGRGVCHVVVAYKADDEKGNNPVWEGRRPAFRWVLRGLRCYQARKDSTVGGSGAHRRNNPATWEWTENPIDIRYNWVRGIYAGDLVDQPAMLLVGRGLSAIEAPPQNVFARANLCDEVVGGEPRYRIGGVVSANEPFIEVESDIAAACGGIIVQPEGAVEINPGEARAPVAHFTDDDLIVGSKVSWSEFLGIADNGWINTVVARFVDPAQRWSMRGAPVRREVADIIADGAPREQTLTLSLVTNVRQAERIAEIARRFGRLWGRATVTLPPRFAGVEEGDWVTWQSNRYFGGATRTFQVDAWGSDQGWRHQLTLRQISASVFSDTAPLDDGVIAAPNPLPAEFAAPEEGVWTLTTILMTAGGMQLPALRVTGSPEVLSAEFVRFDYAVGEDEPDEDTVWTEGSLVRPDAARIEFPVTPGATIWVGVSYIVSGITGPRRILGPVIAEDIRYPSGAALGGLQPLEAGADVTATSQREIIPQFPSIEIRQFEAGNVGNRTVTHFARRGGVTLSGGTWSLTSKLLGSGDATINATTGLVTLNGIIQSGSYTVQYLHTDGIATGLIVPVIFGMAASTSGRAVVADPVVASWFEFISTSVVVNFSANDGGTPLTGGTWAIIAGSLTISASIDPDTGVLTIDAAGGPGFLEVRYTHTDSDEIDKVINVQFFASGNPGNPGSDFNIP